MRAYSTPESAHRGEVTKLATIETLASIALYIGICTYANSWRSLALIVVGAPLMLLRTEASADWALKHWRRWAGLADNIIDNYQSSLLLLPALGGYMLASAIVGIALRVSGTVYCAVRMPLYTLQEAPRNWFRQTLCTDFMHPPEIVPLEIVKGNPSEYLLFTDILRLRRNKSPIAILLTYIVSSPLVLLGHLPSAIYRVSFKATSLVYAPFVWAAHATTRSNLPLKLRLERITKGELEKVRRGVSWIVISVLAAKAGLYLGLADPKTLTEKFATARAAELFMVPSGWPWWQLTLATDAVLTFILLFFADAALARLEGAHPWPERTVLDVTSTISFVRVTLSLLTVAHFFGLALHIALPRMAWPW